MRIIITLLFFLIVFQSKSQTINSKNFHATIEGNWVKEIFDVNGKLIKDKNKPSPDTLRFGKCGVVRIISTYAGKTFNSLQIWTLNDTTNKIFYKDQKKDKTFSKNYELYKLTSINKDLMRMEVETMDEVEPGQPTPDIVILKIIYRRIK